MKKSEDPRYIAGVSEVDDDMSDSEWFAAFGEPDTWLLRVERMFREKLGDGLLKEVYDTDAYATGVMPPPNECMDIVHEYGNDMWDLIAEIEGDHVVAKRIMRNGLSKVESYAEFCVSFVALVIGETAWRMGKEKNWNGDWDA